MNLDMSEIPACKAGRETVMQMLTYAYPAGFPHQIETDEYFTQQGTEFAGGQSVKIMHPELISPVCLYITVNNRGELKIRWGTHEPRLKDFREEITARLNHTFRRMPD